jgi:hypothetical protein
LLTRRINKAQSALLLGCEEFKKCLKKEAKHIGKSFEMSNTNKITKKKNGKCSRG